MTDRSFDDEMNDRRTSPPELSADLRMAPYLQSHPSLQVPFHPHASQSGGSGTKPEWKRYKQYTRQDINMAIEEVRNGMSALQASRKYGVPSRTLYDKVKKLGITTGTPRNRSSSKREARESSVASSSLSAAFPYPAIMSSMNPAGSSFQVYPNQPERLSQSQEFEDDEMRQSIRRFQATLMESNFLQKATETRARGEDDHAGLQAMAIACLRAQQLNGMNPQSEPLQDRSSRVLAEYMSRSLERELNSSNGSSNVKKEPPPDESDNETDNTDVAENLSISKREKSPSTTPPPMREIPSVIVQPQFRYSSPPQIEPTSTTPPTSHDEPMISDLSPNKTASESPPMIPKTSENFDD